MEIIKLFKVKRSDPNDGFIYEYASKFINGASLVCINGIYEFIKKDGNVLYVTEKNDNLIMTWNDYDYVCGNTNFVTTSHFINKYNFNDGLALVFKNSKYGYIDKLGNLVIDYQYNDARNFSLGLACVSINGKCGYIDINNNIIIPFNNYDRIYDFKDNLALIKKNNKYGYIDRKGNFIVEPIYDNALSFNEGLACIKKDNKYGYIDTSGKIISSNFRKFEYVSSITNIDIDKIVGYYAAFITDNKVVVLEENEYIPYLKKMMEIFNELNREDIFTNLTEQKKTKVKKII